jgi:hypothetical protein
LEQTFHFLAVYYAALMETLQQRLMISLTLKKT